ncbi:syntaxin 18, partial [Tremellales sp. Uapishka_1]
MVYIDQTPAFHAILDEQKAAKPRPRSTSPRRNKGKGKNKDEYSAEFLQEAYRIYRHLDDLAILLKQIRKPYLSSEGPSRRDRQAARATQGEGSELTRWKGVKYLSDRDRDEIDQLGKIIVRRCRERVGLLEDLEKAKLSSAATPAMGLLSTLLPSFVPPDETFSSSVLTAHRAAILWTLNSLLTTLVSHQAHLQEERAKRRLERSNNLGAGAAREAAKLSLYQPLLRGDTLEEDDPSLALSPDQLLQFESENSALLQHMESTLSSVLSAEKSLLEISTLQSELVKNLLQQTEMTDRLYDEAVGSVGEMKKANQQLKKAKERGGEARLFLLVFLIGASLALLFVDWYK